MEEGTGASVRLLTVRWKGEGTFETLRHVEQPLEPLQSKMVQHQPPRAFTIGPCLGPAFTLIVQPNSDFPLMSIWKHTLQLHGGEAFAMWKEWTGLLKLEWWRRRGGEFDLSGFSRPGPWTPGSPPPSPRRANWKARSPQLFYHHHYPLFPEVGWPFT